MIPFTLSDLFIRPCVLFKTKIKFYSGLSSDQQFSPVSFDEIEEDVTEVKPDISGLDESMLSILCDTSSDQITLHKSDDDDPIDGKYSSF